MSKNLLHLSQFQPRILLVYRPTATSGWSDRCFYGDNKYDPNKHYNHRTILEQEVVIEFDSEDIDSNRKLADTVSTRLRRDGIRISKWYSGGKSVHVHCLLRTGTPGNLALLKRCFIRHYTKALPPPDLQLTAANHLIRLEGGLHEKTGKHKTLIWKDAAYPCLSEIPEAVWEMYREEYRRSQARSIAHQDIDYKKHPAVQFLLKTEDVDALGDGRSNGLFLLCHVLKGQYTLEELTAFLQGWYKYSGGHKYSPEEIARMVKYQYPRTYRLQTLLDNFQEQFMQGDKK